MELQKSLDTCLIVDMSACQLIVHALLAGACLAGPWRDLFLKLVTSAPWSIILNWTGSPFNSNSIIHWLSLLCVDVISIVPTKGSSLTVSVRIVAKFVTDLHTDSGLVFHTYSM